MPVRLATPADARAVARVQAETWRAAYAGLIPDHVLAGMSEEAGTPVWVERLAEPGTWVYVAEEGGEVVGFASGGRSRDADLGPGWGEVYALYVLPETQRRGCGRALLGVAAERVLRDGDTALAIWVLGTNAPGRAFYEALGWAADGSERAFDLGDDSVVEVRYRRELAPRP